MKTSTLSVEQVSHQFAGKNVLSSLSFSISEGEQVAIIGPSGAGKTTLLNILAGILEPSQGQVSLGQIPLSHLRDTKARAKQIGVIRQQFDLVKELPVYQNVLMGKMNDWHLARSLWSMISKTDKQLAGQTLEAVGLRDLLGQTTGSLSGGEQQRVAIARLILQDPKVILADEPIASLDPRWTKEVMDTLTGEARSRFKTLIAILHSTQVATTYFDRIIGLKDGHVQFDKKSCDLKDSDLQALYAQGPQEVDHG